MTVERLGLSAFAFTDPGVRPFRVAFVEFGPPVRARRRIPATGEDGVIPGAGVGGAR